MVTIAQRIEALRTERNISRPELSAALGFPRTAVEKFETGRQTPTKDQQKKMADYFGVSLNYLQGKDDAMSEWMSDDGQSGYVPMEAPKPKRASKPAVSSSGSEESGSMLDAMLTSRKFQEALREAALDALRSPEGQEILVNIVRKELGKSGR